jgi:predicted amidohydrolase
MKLALAQIRSLKGDIDGNIAHHVRWVKAAAAQSVDLIVFPELSLTEYDPLIVDVVATTVDDPRFAPLQVLADGAQIAISVGVPLREAEGVVIAMLIFQPGRAVEVYSKRYLHDDELPYFAPGHGGTAMQTPAGKLAFAICYELSIPQHVEDAHADGAAVYLASVAKTPSGVIKAHARLAEIAHSYGMTVLMANCVGECEGKPAGGKSAVWDTRGAMVASLGEDEEGLLIFVTPSAGSS